ncbi:MAG: hypothetical protein ABFC80_03920 [Coriobacteriales bacterium]
MPGHGVVISLRGVHAAIFSLIVVEYNQQQSAVLELAVPADSRLT